jgi:hypothetical protein
MYGESTESMQEELSRDNGSRSLLATYRRLDGCAYPVDRIPTGAVRNVSNSGIYTRSCMFLHCTEDSPKTIALHEPYFPTVRC